MTAPTLPEFLLARLAEDEAAAKAATPGPWSGECIGGEGYRVYAPAGPDRRGRRVAASVTYEDFDSCKADAAHIARHDPARVLAEVEAKRAIVNMLVYAYPPLGELESDYANAADDACRHLASVYSDHPDWREEWKV